MGAVMTKQELTECIDTYGRELYSFCRHLAGNAQEADELYQDTWLKTVELLENIDSTGNVKSYCLSVALRLWKNR
ncbi:MAG: RNA polymerase sigma factor, partial [Blautia sp.]|nr:RNA polymerase sigma factor [Blautia sp.]